MSIVLFRSSSDNSSIKALFGFMKRTPSDCEGDGSGYYYFGGRGACSGVSELIKLNEGREGSEDKKPLSSSGSLSLGRSNSGSSAQ